MRKTIYLFLFVIVFFNTQAVFSQQPVLGEIRMFAGNFPPKYWALCNGQLLPIMQNQALFSIIGTYYGGNGVTNFALPDLRGRVPVHKGQGSNISPIVLGELSGSETTTLTINQMPAHIHTVASVTSIGNQKSPNGNLPANTKTLDKEYSNQSATVTMNSQVVGSTGGNQPINTMPPYSVVTFIIATQGIFPSRN